MLYAISAVVNKTEGSFVRVLQVPTFYLDANVQGIVSSEHAEQIAREIINPTKDATVTVFASAFIVG